MAKRYISERNKVLLLSLAVGVCAGTAAVILLSLIELVKGGVGLISKGTTYNWPMLFLPGLGMLLSMLLVRYVIKDNIGHGVTKVLQAVSTKESRIKPHNTWSSLLTSALTIGMGGSVGAEAPIVYTGAAIGSNIARHFGMSYRNMTILLGCGAAGAIAGIFKAPLAGVLFTMEILLFNISMSSMVPLLLSTVSATVISYLFTGGDLPFQCTITPFSMVNIPFYIILGVACGLMSVYFVRTTLALEDSFSKRKNPYVKWAIGAVSLGIMIVLFPPLYGEGYEWVRLLLNGGELPLDGTTVLSSLTHSPWGLVLFFLLVMFIKVLSMTMTNAGGGVGGTFGPTLFVGAIAGFVVSRTINLVLVGTGLSVPEQNFVLVGMAGLMAGVMQAPLTAIFLIAEVTGGYELFLPLIITATIAFGTTRLFEKYSIYTKRIAQTGELLTHDSDRAVLTLLKISDLVRDKYPRVDASDTLGDVVTLIKNDNSQVFAVVDSDGVFQGQITLDYIHGLIFRTEEYDTLRVSDFMDQPPVLVYADDNMESVMDKFDRTGAWRLPVITDDKHYLGYVSRSRILTAYRQELKIISQD